MIPVSSCNFQKVKLLLRQGSIAAETNATDQSQKIFRRAIDESQALPKTTAGMLLRTICTLKCLRNVKLTDHEFFEKFIILKEEVEKLDQLLSHQAASHPYLGLLGTIYLYLYRFTLAEEYIHRARKILVRVAQNKAVTPQQQYPSPQAHDQFEAYIQAGVACLYSFREELDYSEKEQINIDLILDTLFWFEKAFSIYKKSESLIYLLGLSNAFLDHLVSLQPPQYPQPTLLAAIEVLHCKEDTSNPDPLQRLFLRGVCQYRAAFNEKNPHKYELITLGIQAYDTLFKVYKGNSTDKSFKGDANALVFVADSARWLYWMTRLPFYQQKAAFFIAQAKNGGRLPCLVQFVVKIYEIQNHLIEKTVDKIPSVVDELRTLLKKPQDDSTIAERLLINLQTAINTITIHFQKLKKLQEPEYNILATSLGDQINALTVYNLSTNAICKELKNYNQMPDLDESLIEEKT